MNQKHRKLGFHEIGKGSLAIDVQEAFEEAQKIACEKFVGAKVTLTISVEPANPREPNFGQVKYAVNVTHGQPAAKQFSTLLKDGIVVADGDDPADILQLDLELPAHEKPNLRVAQGA